MLRRDSGDSTEFHDHRSYSPGDDPRRINWAAYARTGHLSLKLFRQEGRPLIDCLIDVSPSMWNPGAKAERTLELIYFIIESAAAQQAGLRLWAVAATSVTPLPNELFYGGAGWVEQLPSPDDDALPITTLNVPIRSGSRRILLSDVLFPVEPNELVRPLTLRNGSATVLAPWHPEEADPEWRGVCQLDDSETQAMREIEFDSASGASLPRRLRTTFRQLAARLPAPLRIVQPHPIAGSARRRPRCRTGHPQPQRDRLSPMQFANPWGLLALVGIPAVLFIHALRRSPKTFLTNTLFLLEAKLRDPGGGRKLRKLRRSAQLWLRLLLVALLAWVIARPVTVREDSTQRVVLVVDESASMSAFKEALVPALREVAKPWMKQTAHIEWIALSSVPDAPPIYRGWDDFDALIDRMEKLEPREGSHDPNGAINLALGLASSHGRVVFVTDYVPEPARPGIGVLAVGAAVQNVGWCGIDASPRRLLESDSSQLWWFPADPHPDPGGRHQRGYPVGGG